MFRIKKYWVFKDTRSEPYELNVDVTEKELSKLRKELEQKHGCFVKSITGDVKRVGYIFFYKINIS